MVYYPTLVLVGKTSWVRVTVEESVERSENARDGRAGPELGLYCPI